MPKADIITILIMVVIVTTPNTEVTAISPHGLFFAAGYINKGINGSQGPKTKTVKSTHGVKLGFPCFS